MYHTLCLLCGNNTTFKCPYFNFLKGGRLEEASTGAQVEGLFLSLICWSYEVAVGSGLFLSRTSILSHEVMGQLLHDEIHQRRYGEITQGGKLRRYKGQIRCAGEQTVTNPSGLCTMLCWERDPGKSQQPEH